MSRTIMLGSLLGISVAMSVGGCSIENCEKGAHCTDGFGDDDDDDGDSEHEQCLELCERMSVCGAPQAKDFDDCVDACEARFQVLPEQTAELCECIPRSRCEDVIDGRCTEPGSGGTSGTGGTHSGGSHSTGGSSGDAGSPSGGTDTGGSAGTGGSSGTGGSPETGGSPGTGGSPETGGTSSGGSATGGAGTGGAGGEDPGIACTCSCQCPSGETCVDGYCSG